MTRIAGVVRLSTYNTTQNTTQEIMRAQQAMQQAQMEISSGKKARDLGDHGRDAQLVAATLNTRDRYENYKVTGQKLSSELEAQALSLRELSSVAVDLRQAMTEAVAAGDGVGMMDRIKASFDQAVAALNINFGGKFLFSGARTDTPPVAVNTLDELSALPSSDDAFADDDIIQSARVDDGANIEYGLRAQEDIASDLFAAFRSINDYANSQGGLDGQLTEAQMTALRTQIGGLPAIIDNLSGVEATNGAVQKRVENAIARQDDRLVTLETILGRLIDADMADAAARLQMAQTTLQASAQAFSILKDATILNYL